MPDPRTSSQTDWSMIANLHAPDRDLAADALERLVRRYWPAIYAYIRGSGFDIHETADLTQGFVADVVLGRRLIHGADPAKGRLRALLLASVRNYVASHRRRLNRGRIRKNSSSGTHPPPAVGAIPPWVYTAAASPVASPEQAFIAQWSATIIHEVLRNVREGCIADGLSAHWEIFDARVARPLITGAKPVPHAQLVERHQLAGPAVSANMIVPIKRRFVRALIAEIGLTVKDPAQVEIEIHDLLRALEAHS
jgi:DNA-directed RNA polymerase specialized sigma24 family protein